MGTIGAPAYANIFMTEFEQKYIYLLIKGKSILFLRYIDDILMVLTKSESSENSEKILWVNWIKNILYKVRLQIWLQANRIPSHFSLYRWTKQTTNYSFRKIKWPSTLNAKSEHPYSLKKSIPYSRALRIWRICSTFQDYNIHSRNLIEQFVDKGYKKMSYSKFRKLTNSIENNCPTNKNVMIKNVYHYQ